MVYSYEGRNHSNLSLLNSTEVRLKSNLNGDDPSAEIRFKPNSLKNFSMNKRLFPLLRLKRELLLKSNQKHLLLDQLNYEIDLISLVKKKKMIYNNINFIKKSIHSFSQKENSASKVSVLKAQLSRLRGDYQGTKLEIKTLESILSNAEQVNEQRNFIDIKNFNYSNSKKSEPLDLKIINLNLKINSILKKHKKNTRNQFLKFVGISHPLDKSFKNKRAEINVAFNIPSWGDSVDEIESDNSFLEKEYKLLTEKRELLNTYKYLSSDISKMIQKINILKNTQFRQIKKQKTIALKRVSFEGLQKVVEHEYILKSDLIQLENDLIKKIALVLSENDNFSSDSIFKVIKK